MPVARNADYAVLPQISGLNTETLAVRAFQVDWMTWIVDRGEATNQADGKDKRWQISGVGLKAYVGTTLGSFAPQFTGCLYELE